MKQGIRDKLGGYFAQADSWASDRQDDLRASRRTAWIVAALALGIASLEAVALIVLTPLKTVEPYTLMVDRQTGFVQALQPLDPQLKSSQDALTESFLVQYVIAREGFNIHSLQSDYKKVALWSSGSARAAYISGMNASNPSSKLAAFPRSAVQEVRVKSVSNIGKDTAMVRFDTSRQAGVGPASPAQDYVAIIHYQFSGEPMRTEDRFINPLGFKVARYQVNPEALPAPVPVNQTSAPVLEVNSVLDAGAENVQTPPQAPTVGNAR